MLIIDEVTAALGIRNGKRLHVLQYLSSVRSANIESAAAGAARLAGLRATSDLVRKYSTCISGLLRLQLLVETSPGRVKLDPRVFRRSDGHVDKLVRVARAELARLNRDTSEAVLVHRVNAQLGNHRAVRGLTSLVLRFLTDPPNSRVRFAGGQYSLAHRQTLPSPQQSAPRPGSLFSTPLQERDPEVDLYASEESLEAGETGRALRDLLGLGSTEREATDSDGEVEDLPSVFDYRSETAASTTEEGAPDPYAEEDGMGPAEDELAEIEKILGGLTPEAAEPRFAVPASAGVHSGGAATTGIEALLAHSEAEQIVACIVERSSFGASVCFALEGGRTQVVHLIRQRSNYSSRPLIQFLSFVAPYNERVAEVVRQLILGMPFVRPVREIREGRDYLALSYHVYEDSTIPTDILEYGRAVAAAADALEARMKSEDVE